ncbi:type II toxin-antitoxin system PemI/MazE family antitoxin [Companilactobacillus mishanensis]|uniref:type II toxin-antitoxin system PemI/MazE family antitoxin n=1 Tax=Companilactobacillus mishanensis TaxID=2486008 RepID=UPI0012980295|nr:AbrB family transcriptional regulator [Companilactobacillus mishanensis]MQS89821.1 AbrB family transcriptional regulator [Companilactobacillus mishanensis]
MKVKPIKQGTSLMFTIPSEFKVLKNSEYKPQIDERGVITFTPVHTNIFEENKDYDFKSAMKKMNIADNGLPVGNENVW